MNLVFEKLTRSLAANQLWRTGIAANFFRLSEAAYPVTVRLYKDNRELGTMSNLLAGDYVRDVEFDAVQVENGATAQSVTVQIAGGGVGSDRVLGEVSVISGERSRVDAQTAFWGSAYAPPSAGNYSHTQLWNPAASGKLAYVTSISIASGVAGYFYIRYHTAALTTLNAPANCSSKRLGSPNSLLENRSQLSATVLGTQIGFLKNETTATLIVPLTEPIRIDPGFGLVFQPPAVNADCIFTAQYYEEPV